MTSEPTPTEISKALQTLARAVAPYVAGLLRDDGLVLQHALRADATPIAFDDAVARDFVAGLGPDLTENALVFFEALSQPPHRIDSIALADLLGAVSPRDLAGLLTTPMKRQANRLGLNEPPWKDGGRQKGRTVWLDRDGTAAVIHRVLLNQVKRQREQEPTLEDRLAHPGTRHPAPSSVYVWAPEYADFRPKDEGEVFTASCLRTDRPGTRAVVYRAHEDQGIVALFDVGEEPKADKKWGYMARGRIHRVDPPVTRAELLEDPALDRVFAHIQGRRRLPLPAQDAITTLLSRRFAKRGGTGTSAAPPNREGSLPIFHGLKDK